MKVELIHDARIRHKAGEVVEVSPAEYDFLIATGTAKSVIAAKAEAKPAKKSAKK